MNISTKLTLTMAASGLVLFGAYGVYLLDREASELESATIRQTELLGQSLQISLENALRDRQLDDVRELLDGLERIDPSVDVFVIDPDGVLGAKSSDAPADSLPLPEPPFDVPPGDLRWEPQHSRLVMSWPLEMEQSDRPALLVVVRPLTDLENDLSTTRWAIVLTVSTFVAITALLGLLLGVFYIRRPLSRIARGMAQLRQRGSAEAQPVPSGGELAPVVEEFNLLAADLGRARRELAREHEARLALEKRLLHVDKLVTVGRLSAGLAHEIGSPLQILNGRARALLAAAHDPERVRRNAQILVEQTDRVAGIVEQLLQYARRRPPVIAPMDPVATVGAVVELLQAEARRRGVTLKMDAGAAPKTAVADASQVQQVVLNLVANALAATDAGGEVLVQLETSTLQAVSGRALPALRLSVVDTGCGMDDGVQRQLFQPFFTTRPSDGGTGLGLSVVAAIVSEHRGTVQMSSRPGKGSRFVVDLPVEGPSAAQGLAS